LVKECIEDIPIAVTTHAGSVPGKDWMVEDVEEVHADFKLIVFPLREWNVDSFGQTNVKAVEGWST